MRSRPSADLRRRIVSRANNRCEYCRIHQDDSIAAHQIDHVIAEKHGGQTTAENLALACLFCNLRKGSDLSSLDPITGVITPIFNPREQSWVEHFQFEGARIHGKTVTGRTTATFLQFNSYERIAERRELIRAGRVLSPE